MKSNLIDGMKNKKVSSDKTFYSNENFEKYELTLQVFLGKDNKITIDLTDILQQNLDNYSNFTKFDLIVQDERISSIQFMLVDSIVYLQDELKDLELEYREWLAKNMTLSKDSLLEKLKLLRQDSDAKTLVKAPTRDEVLDNMLNQSKDIALDYESYEKDIAFVKNKISHTKSVLEILSSRSITIKTILNKMGELSQKNYDSNI